MTAEVGPMTDDRMRGERPPEPAAPRLSGSDTEAKILVASQWTLMWRKFRKHRLAMVGGSVTILIYLVVLFAEFLAPFPGVAFSSEYTYAPPQPLHLFDQTPEGRRFAPYVNGYRV